MSLPPLPAMGATTKAENYDKITAWANAVGALALNALPIKGALDDRHLDAVTEPGIYYQESSSKALKIKGYPADGWLGILKVHRGSPTSWAQPIIWHEYTAFSGRVESKRQLTSGAWTAWNMHGARRVDSTVGRAFYVWDHTNNREQLDATSDSGLWRIELNPEVQYNGIVNFQRKGYDVTAEINVSGLIAGQTSWNGTLVSIPAGFAPTNIYYKDTFRTSTGILLDIGQVDGKITITGAGTGTSGVLRCRIGWPVTAAWPATPPPGNQVGSVPWQ